MKSNLFFFVLFFLSPFSAFLTGKNKNTWSCQAKFGEVNPHKKIIFLLEYSSFFKIIPHEKNKKTYSDYSMFRPVKPQITIKLLTKLVICHRYFYVFMASILSDMHDRNWVCFVSICLHYL